MESQVAYLRSSLRMRIASAFFFAAPAVFVLNGAFSRAEGHSVLVSGACSLILWYFAVITGFVRWRIDAYGLERVTPLTKAVSVPWSEVASVVENHAKNLVFRRRLGRAVEVSRVLDGVNDLRRLALLYLPPVVVTDETRRMLEPRADSIEETTAVPIDAPEPVAASSSNLAVRWAENPFFVLDLSPECSRADVERVGHKLLALLAIESGAARRFKTPVGDRERTADLVRAAMAELRDPEKRLGHEVWARVGHDGEVQSATRTGHADPWPGAMLAIGWRRT